MSPASDAGALKRKATVEVRVTEGGGGLAEGPFVMHIPSTGGMPPDGTEFRAWRKNEEFRGHQLLLRGRAEGVDYVGSNFASPTAAPAEACKYLVARLRPLAPASARGGGGGGEGADDDDAPTHALELAPAGGGAIIDLETRCHALEYGAPAWDGAEDLNDPSVRAAHNAKLLAAFSSAKRQRKVARIRAERAIDAASLAAPDAMAATLQAATANELDAKALAKLAGERRNIPAHDPTATNPRDAYPLERFPLYPVLDERTRWRDLLKASKKPSAMKQLRDEGAGVGFDAYVLDLVPRLADVGGIPDAQKELERERAKALAALDVLLEFHAHRGVVTERREKRGGDEGGEGGDPGDDASLGPLVISWAHDARVHPVVQRAAVEEWMEEQVRDDGGGGGGGGGGGAGRVARRFARPKPAADLVVLHAVLMALRVGGWEVDLTALAERMRVGVADLAPHCKELGCVVKKTTGKASEGGGRTLAALKLDGTKPLGDLLPEIKRRPQAARKRD